MAGAREQRAKSNQTKVVSDVADYASWREEQDGLAKVIQTRKESLKGKTLFFLSMGNWDIIGSLDF